MFAVTGFDSFLPFTKDTFVTSYVALPIFGLLWLGYKLWYKTELIALEEVDLISGKREIDEEEEAFALSEEKAGLRTVWQKLCDGL